MTTDEIAETMFKPFLANFDQHMMKHSYEPHAKHPDPEEITKGAAKALFMIEKVISDAGGPFQDTYKQTMFKLKNGQAV